MRSLGLTSRDAQRALIHRRHTVVERFVRNAGVGHLVAHTTTEPARKLALVLRASCGQTCTRSCALRAPKRLGASGARRLGGSGGALRPCRGDEIEAAFRIAA